MCCRECVAASYHHPYSCSLMEVAADDAVGDDVVAVVDVDVGFVDVVVVVAAAVDVDDLTSR